MVKIDKNTIRPAKAKVKDPYRYPNVSEVIENKSKDEFKLQINKMRADITYKMTKFLKNG